MQVVDSGDRGVVKAQAEVICAGPLGCLDPDSIRTLDDMTIRPDESIWSGISTTKRSGSRHWVNRVLMSNE